MQPNPARVLERLTSRLGTDFWQHIEQARANAAARGYVPDPQVAWMFADTFQIVLDAHGGALWRHACQDMERGITDSENIHESYALPALSQWRLTRGMYEFDETLREMLAETELEEVPTDAIRNLPEYAPYIVLNGYRYRGENLHGCWITRMVAPDGQSALQITLHYQRNRVWALSFGANSGQNIEQMVAAAFASVRELATKSGLKLDDQTADIAESVRLVRYVLSLTLYLCSQEPDITGLVAPIKNKTQRGKVVMVKPEKDNLLQVGYRLGGKIRMWREAGSLLQKEQENGLGLPKAPHLRKAHWHLYWTGMGRTIPRVKWVMPVAVNVKNIDEIATHIRPVIADPADER